MTDEDRRARRRARNSHALAHCNGMGRTAGSVLWQPMRRVDGKYFMACGAELAEPPIEFRSEKLETILDEMDARDMDAPKPPVQPFKEWQAEVNAAYNAHVADQASRSSVPLIVATPEATYTIPVGQEMFVPINPQGGVVSLSELEKAIAEQKEPEMAEPIEPVQPPEPMLQFFEYAHLPEHLQEVSMWFGALAQSIVHRLPRNPERTVALRKLLEAKDCAVRARLYKP